MAAEGFSGQDRLMTMYGGMDSQLRESVKAAFQACPSQSPSEFFWLPMLRPRGWTYRIIAPA